jgi:hypothetical protein
MPVYVARGNSLAHCRVPAPALLWVKGIRTVTGLFGLLRRSSHVRQPLRIAAALVLVAGAGHPLGAQDPASGQSVRVNAMEMYYEVHGTGEPLVLLHGFSMPNCPSWAVKTRE